MASGKLSPGDKTTTKELLAVVLSRLAVRFVLLASWRAFKHHTGNNRLRRVLPVCVVAIFPVNMSEG